MMRIMKAALVGIFFLSLVLGIFFFSLTPVDLSGEFKSFGDWRYGIETGADSQTHLAETFALTGGEEKFIFWCEKPRGVLFVVYHTGKNMGKKDEMREVTHRVDKNPPVKQQWKFFQTGIIRGKMIDAHAMADALMGGHELVIQTYDSDDNRVQSTFSLDGAGDAMARVLKNCPAILSGDWMYMTKTDERNYLQVYWTVTFTRTGEEGKFGIRCDQPRGVLSVVYQTRKNIGKYGEMREVTYRVDKNPPVKQQWKALQTAVGTEKPIEVGAMADALMGGHELVIQTDDRDGNRVRRTFSLDGAGDAIARVLKSCAFKEWRMMSIMKAALVRIFSSR